MRTELDVVWRLHRLTLGQADRRTWQEWRRAGPLGMAAYLGGFGLVGLVSLWQTYRFPAPALEPQLFAGLAAAWWLSAWLARRPALGLDDTETALLRAPVPPWTVLVWPLTRLLGAYLASGLGLGLLLIAWVPAWWPLALALPPLLAGRPLVQTLAHDLRLTGHSRARNAALGLSVLPLLGAFHPALLLLACAFGVVGLLLIWRQFWEREVYVRPLLHARVEGLRQGARRFGMSVAEVGPDGFPFPRRWQPHLRGSGAFAACLWRGWLHLTRRPWRLLAASVVGLGVAAGSPLLLALALGPLLTVLTPPLPAGLPLGGFQGRLSRTVPGGLVLGTLLAVGVGAGTVLGFGSLLSVLTALVLPWAALGVLGWLGEAAPGEQTSGGQLRFAAALAPAMGPFCVPPWGSAGSHPWR